MLRPKTNPSRKFLRLLAGLAVITALATGSATAQDIGPTEALADTGALELGVAPCDFEEVFYFDFDESSLRRDQGALVDQLALCLDAFAEVNIVLEGHVAPQDGGTFEFTFVIGERRARTIRRALERAGVDPERVETISYGRARPICTADTPACAARNRRVEVTVQADPPR